MELNGKKILVTGACGFIGGYLVEALIKSDYSVKAFDFKNSFDAKSITHPFSDVALDKLKICVGNIEDIDSLKNSSNNIDHIFHLAARSFIPDSWNYPLDFFRTNIIGVTNVLDICRRNNCSLTIISSYVYGEPEYLPIDENHPLKSYNPYSLSKIIAEEICDIYKRFYGLKITVFRPFNVYGPGQNEMFLIPEIIRQILSKDKEIVEVNELEPKRDYIYIDDLINALKLSIECKDDIYNVGSGYSVSVEDIIKIAMNISGIEKKYISRNIKRKNEIYNVVANISKATNNLQWSPTTDFEKGIENCINYYRKKF